MPDEQTDPRVEVVAKASYEWDRAWAAGVTFARKEGEERERAAKVPHACLERALRKADELAMATHGALGVALAQVKNTDRDKLKAALQDARAYLSALSDLTLAVAASPSVSEGEKPTYFNSKTFIEPFPAGSGGASSAFISEGESECLSCGEGNERGECPQSRRPCGHHCNHSWSHDKCDWCDTTFGEITEDEQTALGAVYCRHVYAYAKAREIAHAAIRDAWAARGEFDAANTETEELRAALGQKEER